MNTEDASKTLPETRLKMLLNISCYLFWNEYEYISESLHLVGWLPTVADTVTKVNIKERSTPPYLFHIVHQLIIKHVNI